MMKKVLYIAAGLLILASIAISIEAKVNKHSIGVIRLNYVFDQFKGSKMAADKLLKYSEKVKVEYEAMEYKLEKLDTSASDYSKRRLGLMNDLDQMNRSANEKYQQISDELSAGVQNQIHTYLDLYRTEKGFDLLISNYNGVGALSYSTNIDCTEDFLKGLNHYYFE